MSDIYKELIDENDGETYFFASSSAEGYNHSSTPNVYRDQYHPGTYAIQTSESANGSYYGGDSYHSNGMSSDYSQLDSSYMYTSAQPNYSYDLHRTNERQSKPDKNTKGLRHFSMKVCEKVQQKRVTSYNEVADELVQELSEGGRFMNPEGCYDQKNIRRRVYDALNVLMAMNIITKEKKEIRWVGLPANSIQECSQLQNEKNSVIENVREKIRELRELIIQQVCLKNLVERNKQLCQTTPITEPHTPPSNEDSFIKLPFVVINSHKHSVIDCSISENRDEYTFTMSSPFELHDDMDMLKRLGLSCNLDSGRCNADDIRLAKSLVPKSLECYIEAIANHTVEEFEEFILSERLGDFLHPDIKTSHHYPSEDMKYSSYCNPNYVANKFTSGTDQYSSSSVAQNSTEVHTNNSGKSAHSDDFVHTSTSDTDIDMI